MMHVGVEVALSVQLSMTNLTRQIDALEYVLCDLSSRPLARAFGKTLEVGCMDGRSVDGTASVPSLRE
jgi:hypothetical protein